VFIGIGDLSTKKRGHVSKIRAISPDPAALAYKIRAIGSDLFATYSTSLEKFRDTITFCIFPRISY